MRDLLDDLAHDVPDYADADRALAAARTTRRRRAGSGVALAAAALALVAAVGVTPEAGPGPGWPPASPRSQEPLPPAETLPDLPAGAVGPARLTYHMLCALPCSRSVVVLADGARYSLDNAGDVNTSALSPDGRLLVAPFERGSWQVRDLDGAEPARPFEPLLMNSGWQPMAWSPDSRWLVLWSPVSGGRSRYARVDLRTLRSVTYEAPADRYTIAVLNSGELLMAPRSWTLPRSLWLVDPGADTTRLFSIRDTPGLIPPGQSVQNDPTGPAMLSPDGKLGLTVRTADYRVTGLLEIDLGSGEVLGLSSTGAWTPLAYTAGGMHVGARNPTRVGILDPATGAVTQVVEPSAQTPFPPTVHIPGGHAWQ